MEWQPIGSAQKDGTAIIVGGYAECFMNKLSWKEDVVVYRRGLFRAKWQGWCWDVPPTHWRPLPEPPEAKP
jgi:hypothetical protein